jgi:hypothetical protein
MTSMWRDIICAKMSDKAEQRDEFDLEHVRIDRSVVRVFSSHAEAEAPDKAYWLSRSPHERLRHMEILRGVNHDPSATARLLRILESASRQSS